MNVDEHTASTQVSLTDRFLSQTETAEGETGADESNHENSIG